MVRERTVDSSRWNRSGGWEAGVYVVERWADLRNELAVGRTVRRGMGRERITVISFCLLFIRSDRELQPDE